MGHRDSNYQPFGLKPVTQLGPSMLQKYFINSICRKLKVIFFRYLYFLLILNMK